MSAFDDINNKLGLQPMSAADMNKIHFDSGEHSDVNNAAQPINLKKV